MFFITFKSSSLLYVIVLFTISESKGLILSNTTISNKFISFKIRNYIYFSQYFTFLIFHNLLKRTKEQCIYFQQIPSSTLNIFYAFYSLTRYQQYDHFSFQFYSI